GYAAATAGSALIAPMLLTARPAGATTCVSSDDCPAGSICVGGECRLDNGGSSCGSGTDNSCPFGYSCVDGGCQPPVVYCPGGCPSGQSCSCTTPGAPSTCLCVDDCPTQCPPGSVCNPSTHTCDPSPASSPDVTGVWFLGIPVNVGGNGKISAAIRSNKLFDA